MSGESTSTQPLGVEPSPVPGHVNPSDRFATFADYIATSGSLPQAGATTLDVARAHVFTGELTFLIEPAVRMYLDCGIVYYAERVGDLPLGSRLLQAEVVDAVQLHRGVVSIGDVDHLGRLFERDDTVDRDAVMVLVEEATDQLVEEVANSVTAAVTVTAHRHHPSGIHRWFVASDERSGASRPSSGVMQVDRSVVDDLPRVTATPDHPAAGTAAVPMSIEWSESETSEAWTSQHDPNEQVGDETTGSAATDGDLDVQAELDRLDADRSKWSAAGGRRESPTTESVDSPLGEFRIVWPDGSDSNPMAAAGDPAPDPDPDPDPEAEAEAEPDRATSAPVDVSGAVRRALQVMQDSSAAPRPIGERNLGFGDLATPASPRRPRGDVADRITDTTSTAGRPSADPLPTPSNAASEGPARALFDGLRDAVDANGFAPPTLDMRAEHMYERAANRTTAPVEPPPPGSADQNGATPPTDSVEDPPATGPATDRATEGGRRSALRRLIDDLRDD